MATAPQNSKKPCLNESWMICVSFSEMEKMKVEWLQEKRALQQRFSFLDNFGMLVEASIDKDCRLLADIITATYICFGHRYIALWDLFSDVQCSRTFLLNGCIYNPSYTVPA